MQAFERYHRFLMDWHCRNFFNFRRHLSASEWTYLEHCFGLADAEEAHRPSPIHFSYFSYSHRIDADRCNSSRLAYGSLTQPEEIWPFAQAVSRERGLSLPPRVRTLTFGGLGWDLQEGQFKLYWRVEDWGSTAFGPAPAGCLPQGLVSLTYTGTALSEEKLYHYPDEAQLPEGAYREARMQSSTRGQVSQFDLAELADWPDRLNPLGRRLLRRYAGLGLGLDTIAYQDPDHFTLYFPPRLAH